MARLPHVGTLTLIPISISIPILMFISTLSLSNTRIYPMHHTPMVTFASPISPPCPVFVRKARSRVKFLCRVSELSFNLSLWKLSRKPVSVFGWHKVQVVLLPVKAKGQRWAPPPVGPQSCRLRSMYRCFAFQQMARQGNSHKRRRGQGLMASARLSMTVHSLCPRVLIIQIRRTSSLPRQHLTLALPPLTEFLRCYVKSLKPLSMPNPRSLPLLTVPKSVQLQDGLVSWACFLVLALAPPVNSIVRILPGQRGLSRAWKR